ncbi:MAG: GvpL/GvpF family gas vesicle protein [Terriglobales bacterium]
MAVRLKKKPATAVAKASASTTSGPFYFYGVSLPQKTGTTPKKVNAIGIDNEHRAEAIACAGLECWVTRVSAGFVSDLENRMEDLEWLAEAGVLHQRAVSAIGAEMDLLPARFGTVFLTQASLEKHLASRAKTIQAAFKKVAGAEEWGVKVFMNAPARTGGAAFNAASGHDYLQQKAKALAAQNTRRSTPDAETAKLAAALTKLSRAVAPTGKVSGAQPGLQWQASFLLPRAQRKQWDNVLKKFAERWGDERRIECTGPWPPYSFVE